MMFHGKLDLSEDHMVGVILLYWLTSESAIFSCQSYGEIELDRNLIEKMIKFDFLSYL